MTPTEIETGLPPIGAPVSQFRVVDRAPGRLLLWGVVGGLALEVGVRGGFANAVVAAGLLVVIAALLTDGRVVSPLSRVLVAAAVLPACGLAVRASGWLTASNLLLALGLITLGILQSRSGSLFDTTPGRLFERLGLAVARSVLWPRTLAPLVRRLQPSSSSAQRAGRLGVALVISVPMLGLLVALLAAADPVFASFVSPDVDAFPLMEHLVLGGGFAVAVLMTIVAALGDGRDRDRRGSFGLIEVATMLGLAVAVLALFVVAQLVALTDAGDRLVEEAGLLPADYARSGFFQLCWAAALLLVFLGVVGALATPEVWSHPAIRVLSALVPLLAVGLVVVSLRRMALYDHAFGLTMLRLWVVGAALWMGAVLLMIAARNVGVGGERNWVLGGAVVAAFVLVVAANAANPEAFVVHHNFDRAAEGKRLDLDYLTGLTDDAVPAMVDEMGRDAFRIETDRYVDHAGVERAMRCDDETTGAAALNLAVARAADVRDDVCRGE